MKGSGGERWGAVANFHSGFMFVRRPLLAEQCAGLPFEG